MDVTAPEENREKLMEMIHGNWVSQCIYVAVKLGIADHLKEGPKGSGELSHIVGANHTALYQLLRALAGLGVFHEEPDKHFSLTAMEDFERLLKLSGFSMRSISRMESGFSIIEAVPVCRPG